MANDFSVLNSAVDNIASEIAEAVSLLQNPATDNNDQTTIDAITARLSSAADALKAALPADAPAPVEVAAPVEVSAEEPVAADAPATDETVA